MGERVYVSGGGYRRVEPVYRDELVPIPARAFRPRGEWDGHGFKVR